MADKIFKFIKSPVKNSVEVRFKDCVTKGINVQPMITAAFQAIVEILVEKD